MQKKKKKVSMYKCGRQNYNPYKLYTLMAGHALLTGSLRVPKNDILLSDKNG